jgi:hypothetical protein
MNFNEDSSNAISSIEDSANEDSYKENNNNKDSSKQGSSIEDSSKEGSLNEHSSNRDSSDKDSSNRDSSNRDSSNRDSSDIKPKLSYSELIDIIKLSCKDYQSIDEISKNLDRTPKYLKDVILPKMIKDGILETLYTKYNPNQKYRIKQS